MHHSRGLAGHMLGTCGTLSSDHAEVHHWSGSLSHGMAGSKPGWPPPFPLRLPALCRLVNPRPCRVAFLPFQAGDVHQGPAMSLYASGTACSQLAMATSKAQVASHPQRPLLMCELAVGAPGHGCAPCSGVVVSRSGISPSCCGTRSYDANFYLCCG